MITKFKLFEGHEDVDPYGEENWDEINIGDMVKCIRDNPTYPNKEKILNKGKIYKIEDMMEPFGTILFKLVGTPKWWNENRFKKI